MIINNLLLIAGNGTKSGKTSLACRIIEQLPELEIIAIKITPHFHETTDGLMIVADTKSYSIYEERNSGTSKDTSRMLRSGASKVYFAKVWDNQLPDVFNEILKEIPAGSPVICESPALRNFVEPGLFIIMTSETINKHKEIDHLKALPHVMFQLEKMKMMESVPVYFKEGKWICNEGD